MEEINERVQGRILRSVVLIVAGVLYLVLVAFTFIIKTDLANDRLMQYMLHAAVLLGAFAYLFFADIIYRTETDRKNARLAYVFAALFTLPVLMGRSLGLAAISSDSLIKTAFNFYAADSVSRVMEVASWTTLFPLSMLFLAKAFFARRQRPYFILGIICMLSAVCCFIAFLSLVSTEAIFLWIGVLGWGVLFLAAVIVYLAIGAGRHIKPKEAA